MCGAASSNSSTIGSLRTSSDYPRGPELCILRAQLGLRVFGHALNVDALVLLIACRTMLFA
jgi:hypothetical protein